MTATDMQFTIDAGRPAGAPANDLKSIVKYRLSGWIFDHIAEEILSTPEHPEFSREAEFHHRLLNVIRQRHPYAIKCKVAERDKNGVVVMMVTLP